MSVDFAQSGSTYWALDEMRDIIIQAHAPAAERDRQSRLINTPAMGHEANLW